MASHQPALARPDGGGFLPAEYNSRLAATRAAMREHQWSALVLAGPENIYYLTGLNHQGYFALTLLVVPLTGAPLLVTREMERHTVADQASSCVHVPYADGEDPATAACAAIRQAAAPGERVGVETSSMYLPVDVWLRMSRDLVDLNLCDGSGVVDMIRWVKSPAELVYTQQAARVSSSAVVAAARAAQPGATERDVARAAAGELIAAGSEVPGIAPFVRTQERFQFEHTSWTDRVLEPGDSVLIELSASAGRYHAPVTRTVHVGAPPAGAREAETIARTALEAVAAALRPGARAHTVYEAWKVVIDAGLGHSDYQRHHCGYMVGIGFAPTWTGGPGVVGLRRGSDLEITEGMTFHVLSWLFGQGPADYALSDTVQVTRHGGEILTTTDQPVWA